MATTTLANNPPKDKTPLRLACDALQVGYGASPLLPALTAQVRAGEVWALVGRNGGGKSTLLRTLLGELKPVSGAYTVAPESRLAYVPQRSNHDLCVPARVRDLVEEGVDRGWGFLGWHNRRKSVMQALGVVGAESLISEPFGHLSEGQKQRVLMARALASQPDVLILDEPTSAMDPMAERGIFALLETLRSEHGLAVIMASHSLSVLPVLASHVIFVDRDDQLIVAGEREAVLQDPSFLGRYGQVLSDEASA